MRWIIGCEVWSFCVCLVDGARALLCFSGGVVDEGSYVPALRWSNAGVRVSGQLIEPATRKHRYDYVASFMECVVERFVVAGLKCK